MYCFQCGHQAPDGSIQCPSCGASLVLPVPVATALPETSGLAIASMILGLVAVISANVLLVPGILALVLGYMARNQIRESGGALRGEELAVVGLITGGVATVVGALLLGLTALGFGGYCGCSALSFLPFLCLPCWLPFAGSEPS
ncbi:MAG: DUF4190 domain-containing protein [Chloroflexi bacterium]|nr:DUF4190 domain-containing protein [Chloroflexota bacterium]MBU1751074.1 DUF4190 domain-containing protein [Chloroflexota bacterium]